MTNVKPSLTWLANELGIDNGELKESKNFDSRLKFQKVSYLLKTLGVKPFSRFTFNLYLRGPYSPGLAAQYYDLNGDESEEVSLTKDERETLNWFKELDLKGMEVASSIMLIQNFNGEKVSDEDIYSVLTVSKPWVKKEDFAEVIRELKKRNLA
jgi:uncharacterized protein YwgA